MGSPEELDRADRGSRCGEPAPALCQHAVRETHPDLCQQTQHCKTQIIPLFQHSPNASEDKTHFFSFCWMLLQGHIIHWYYKDLHCALWKSHIGLHVWFSNRPHRHACVSCVLLLSVTNLPFVLFVADVVLACYQCCVIPHVLATHLHTCPANPPTGLLLVSSLSI